MTSEDSLYYRATAKARIPGMAAFIQGRSAYWHDVLVLCLRGAWDIELRQFMPPASLRESLDALLAQGLVERAEDPPELPVFERRRPGLQFPGRAANEMRQRLHA